MTHDEMIAVIRAFQEGKTVQHKIKGSTVWSDTENPTWNVLGRDYRIKPEPRVWFMVLDRDGDPFGVFNNEEHAKTCIKVQGSSYTKVVEVVK